MMDMLEYRSPPAPSSWDDVSAGNQIAMSDHRTPLDGRPKSNSTGRIEVGETFPTHRPSLPNEAQMDQTKKESLLPLDFVKKNRDEFNASRPQTPVDPRHRASPNVAEENISPSPYQSTIETPSPKFLAKSEIKSTDPPQRAALTAPLSELTKSLTHVDIRDMVAFVNRPTEERLKEVEAKHGKVSRPMNCFMLYRSAYAQRTKEWCAQNNHQVVSRVSGESWPLEPQHIRDHYENLAAIERENHRRAHPGYKFAPSKVAAKKKRLREEALHAEEQLDVADAYQFSPSYKRPRPDMTRLPAPYMTYQSNMQNKPVYDQSYNVQRSLMQLPPPYLSPPKSKLDPASLPVPRPTTAPHDMPRQFNQAIGQQSITAYPNPSNLEPQNGYPQHSSQLEPQSYSRGSSMSPSVPRIEPQMVDYSGQSQRPVPELPASQWPMQPTMSMSRPHTSGQVMNRDTNRSAPAFRNSIAGASDYRYQYKPAPAQRDGPTSASIPMTMKSETLWPNDNIPQNQDNLDGWLS